MRGASREQRQDRELGGDSADGDAADPAGRGCSQDNPASTFAPSSGAREASFRPVLFQLTGLGCGHCRGGRGRDGLAPEPPPLLASSRGLSLRKCGDAEEEEEEEEEEKEEEEEGVGGGSPLK
ncbi:hypothetical protein H8959_004263 [Pygathrix nigripes]